MPPLGSGLTGLGNVQTAGQPPGGGGGVDPDFDTLAELYAFGLIDDPDTDNTLVGSRNEIRFNEFGEIVVAQTPASNASDFDTHPGITSERYFTASGFVGTVARWGQRYTGASADTVGGSQQRWYLADDNSSREYAQWQMVRSVPLTGTSPGYSPGLASGYDGPLSYEFWFLENRAGGGGTSGDYRSSDGIHWRQLMSPLQGGSGGPYAIWADQLSLKPIGSSIFDRPEDGTSVRYGLKAIGDGPANGLNVAGFDLVYDAANGGFDRATGHGELWSRDVGSASDIVSMEWNASGITTALGVTAAGATLGGLDVSGTAGVGDLNVSDDAEIGDHLLVHGDVDVVGDVTAATFNGAALPTSGINQLTSDVTAGPGSGSQAATIANAAVTNAKRADMAQSTISGRAAGAGTGVPTDLSSVQVAAILAGDIGSDVQVFTGNGTWTKPTGFTPRLILAYAVAGGGGGGSGRRGAAGSARGGGGGGGSGGTLWNQYPAWQLGATETVTVGAAGTAGAAVGADSTNGAAGGAGGNSAFGAAATLMTATGGAAGAGGTTSGGAGGANGSVSGRSFNNSYANGATGATGGVGAGLTAGGAGSTNDQQEASGGAGGGGGGISAANATETGSNGGNAGNVFSSTIGGGAGGTGSTNGAAGTTAGTNNASGGGGGGGGASNGTGRTGGAGGNYGAGGGGGGASVNGTASGAGGAGSGGIVVVVSMR